MKLKILVLLMIMIMSVSGCSSGRKESFKAEISTSAPSASEQESSDTVYVYVCGEVISPGVYELTAGSRVKDAIVMAGGLSEEADFTAVNQAQKLKDQDKIVVPAKNLRQNCPHPPTVFSQFLSEYSSARHSSPK